jgi:DNA-binding IclR family transcriptional regulator
VTTPEATAPVARVQVIERSLDILEALRDGPRSLTQICRTTSLPKGTAYRLLAGLAARRMVIKDPLTANYALGPGLLRLVQGAFLGIGMIATLGRSALERLAATTQETVALHVPAGVERVCIDEVASPQVIRYTSGVGSSAPLHVGSAGKVLLAFMEDGERERSLQLLEGAADEEAPHGSLRDTIAQAAADGFAISTSERVEGASAISVPVRSDVLLMSMSVLGPTQRLPQSLLLEYLPALRETAGEIAAILEEGPLGDRHA